MNKKRIISILISASMMVGCMMSTPQTKIFKNMTAEAESYYREFYGDRLIIRKVDADEDGISDYVEIDDCDTYNYIEQTEQDTSLTEIVIPSEIDGLPVTGIRGHAFYNCKYLETIVIPDSVTSIGDWAFWECSSLKNITIPDKVTSIGDGTFEDCNSLTSITIPDCVTYIGYSAFSFCRNLENVTLGSSVADIDELAFYYCESLKEIVLPESVKSIDYGAFMCCTSMNSITIENPECEIKDLGTGDTISNGLSNGLCDFCFNGTIYGYENSTAHIYADEYERTFIALDNPAQTTFSGTTNETITTTITAESDKKTKGDANIDNEVNVRDCAVIAKALAQGLGNLLPLSADFNNDGQVSVRDAAAIASALAKGKL